MLGIGIPNLLHRLRPCTQRVHRLRQERVDRSDICSYGASKRGKEGVEETLDVVVNDVLDGRGGDGDAIDLDLAVSKKTKKPLT